MSPKRGFVLATVFFLVVVMVFLASGLFRLIPVELNWALKQRIDTEAYYASTAGVKHAMAWMGAVQARKMGSNFNPPYEPFGVPAGEAYEVFPLPDPAANPYRLTPSNLIPPDTPTNDNTYYPANMQALRLRSERLQLPGDWTAMVVIVPDKWTFPHPHLNTPGATAGSHSPCYTIVSVAFQDSNHNGQCDTALGERYVLRAEVSVVAGTFARYAYFVDEWPDQGFNTVRFALPSNNTVPVFSGPVHTNGIPILFANSAADFWNQVNATTTVVPHFSSDLSFANAVGATYAVPPVTPNYDGIAWLLGNFSGTDVARRPFNVTGGNCTTIAGRYERVFKSGQAALRPRDRIDMPADSDRVALAAWGYKQGDPYPNLAGTGTDELFIRTDGAGNPMGGAIVSGGVRSCLLDVIDTTGVSVANGSYDSPTPTQGAPAVKLVHDVDILYVAGTLTENIPEAVETIVNSTWYETTYSSDPASGGSPVSSQYVANTTTSQLVTVQYGPGQVTVWDSPGGGPAAGVGVPSEPVGTVTQSVTIPIYSSTTIYAVVTGPFSGNHTETSWVPGPNNKTTLIYDTYSPTDLIVEPREANVTYNTTHLLGPPTTVSGAVPISQVLICPGVPGGTLSMGYLEYPFNTTQASILRQSHTDPRVYYVETLKKQLNGATLVKGNLNGLQGWNRGPKTFQCENRVWGAGGNSTSTPFNISITGPIRQFGVSQGSVANNSENPLGLVGNEIVMRAPESRVDPANPQYFWYDATGANNKPLYVHAALLAMSGQYRTDYSTIASKLGALTVVGSVVQKSIGSLFLLTLPPHGWSSSYVYDPYLSVGPPPAFPLDGTFQIYFCRVDTL